MQTRNFRRHPERQTDFHRLRASLEAARAIVAARIAGEVIVVAVALRLTSVAVNSVKSSAARAASVGARGDTSVA